MGLIPDQETIQVGLTLDQGAIQEGLISDQKTIKEGLISDQKTIQAGLISDLKTIQVGLNSDQETIQVGLILYQALLIVAIQEGHKSIQVQEVQIIPTLLMVFPKTCSFWLHWFLDVFWLLERFLEYFWRSYICFFHKNT